MGLQRLRVMRYVLCFAGMEPPQKKQKTTDEMMSEEDFVATHGASGTFSVMCPTDDSKEDWKLSGQAVFLLLCSCRVSMCRVAQALFYPTVILLSRSSFLSLCSGER